MRLIDGDALKLYLQENIEKPPTSIFGVIAKMEMSDIVEAVCKDIDNQPTVDPVRKGKWLWDLSENGWADHICSECGWTKNTDIHVSLGYKFCPNCGSRMKGCEQE